MQSMQRQAGARAAFRAAILLPENEVTSQGIPEPSFSPSE